MKKVCTNLVEEVKCQSVSKTSEENWQNKVLVEKKHQKVVSQEILNDYKTRLEDVENEESASNDYHFDDIEEGLKISEMVKEELPKAQSQSPYNQRIMEFEGEIDPYYAQLQTQHNKQASSLLKNNQIYGVFFETIENQKNKQSMQNSVSSEKGIYNLFYENLQNQMHQTRQAEIKEMKTSGGSIKEMFQQEINQKESFCLQNETDNRSHFQKPQKLMQNNDDFKTNNFYDHQKSTEQNFYKQLKNLPVFQNPMNVLSLKASSLFSNSLLFENEIISVYCKTIKHPQSTFLEATIELTYSPKFLGLTISTKLNQSKNMSVYPAIVVQKPFIQEFTQTFTFRLEKLESLLEFPILKIILKKVEFYHEVDILIPFSINKYATCLPASLDNCLEYLEYVD